MIPARRVDFGAIAAMRAFGSARRPLTLANVSHGLAGGHQQKGKYTRQAQYTGRPNKCTAGFHNSDQQSGGLDVTVQSMRSVTMRLARMRLFPICDRPRARSQ